MKPCYCLQTSGYLTIKGEAWDFQKWKPDTCYACREPA